MLVYLSIVLYLYVYFICLFIVWYVSMPVVCKVRFIQCFVPSLVEIGPVVLEKKMKMWKVYDNNNDANDDNNDANEDNNDDNDDGQRTTDKFWSEKFNWAFGSGEQKSSLEYTSLPWFPILCTSNPTEFGVSSLF